MRLFVIAGEPSGDLHASAIVKSLLLKSDDAKIFGWGGDFLKEAGVDIKVHINDLAIMGITDVFKRLPHFINLYRVCKKQIKSFHPDALLLVDYSGFNLRIAKWAKLQGIFVHFYIAPKTWAWRPSRNKTLAKYVDQLYCIFPFEEEYFKSQGVNASYVGNPLMHISARNQYKEDAPIALLPGSRDRKSKEFFRSLANTFCITLSITMHYL